MTLPQFQITQVRCLNLLYDRLFNEKQCKQMGKYISTVCVHTEKTDFFFQLLRSVKRNEINNNLKTKRKLNKKTAKIDKNVQNSKQDSANLNFTI